MSPRTFLIEARWMLFIPLIDSIYLLLNHRTDHVYTLVTFLDKKIPFISYFIVPYVAWYGLLFVTLVWFMSMDIQLYRSSVVSILVGLIISFIIFSLFQTTVPRPVPLEQNIFSQLTRWVYSIDNPYNAFPSIHVLTSQIIFLGCMRTRSQSPKVSLAIQALVILVVLSTFYLKQHTLLDAFGAFVLGTIVYETVHRYENTLSKPKEQRTEKIRQNENEPIIEIE